MGFVFFAIQALFLAAFVSFGSRVSEPTDNQDRSRPIPVKRLLLLSLGVLFIAYAGIEVTALRTPIFLTCGMATLAAFLVIDGNSSGNRILPKQPFNPRSPVGAALLMTFALNISTMGLSAYGPLLMVIIHGAPTIVAGYVLACVAIGWSIAALIVQYVPRARVLSMQELQAVWQATSTIGYPFGPIIQMLILSGQRRSEIANMRRSWISKDYFEIPAVNFKTGVSQVVPITKNMADILNNQPIWNAGDYLFSTTAGKTPSSGFSKAKRRIDELSGVTDWTLHDIRRSVSTHMAEAGIIQEHIERVLGHAIAGVAGTYNRYSYLVEKRQALDIWGEIVTETASQMKTE